MRKVIDAAQRLGVDTVGTFVGNDKDRPLPENPPTDRPPLVAHAGERGVRIAIENCPMIFSWDEWPGGNNLAWSPAIWDEMPRHHGRELRPQPRPLAPRLADDRLRARRLRLRGPDLPRAREADLEVRRDGLYRHGRSPPIGWQVPRLPGLGEVNWSRFVAALYAVGYDHVISVEHEDRRFEGDLEPRAARLPDARHAEAVDRLTR